MALLTSLLILVIVSLVAVSMYRSFGTQESIAGNTLEKQRSLQAAESALRYGEDWLSRQNKDNNTDVIFDGSCSGTYDGNDPLNMRVCIGANSKLLTPATLPWSSSITYKPPQMPVAATGNINTDSTKGTVSDVNYAKSPALHIALLGQAYGKRLFQVTAVGYGGRESTVSVVQSVYAKSDGCYPPFDTRC
ncbi:PilX N-terminal domain-containing pilus assembly protein [Variovorax robiniae]|uniref:PilX N-terminal domain-containing pilus assembly protein n=1 Tax=Variovorax robiniae TaxID=1836199 RepID=A0ABU8X522_9BURK